jgi:hypothetical protein
MYHTSVGNVSFSIGLENIDDLVHISGGTDNVYPVFTLKATTIPIHNNVSMFIEAYAKWILSEYSRLMGLVTLGKHEVHPVEDSPIMFHQHCEKCVFWGSDTDTGAEERVCRFWDIPERECRTKASDYCSKGYIVRNDEDAYEFDPLNPLNLHSTPFSADPEVAPVDLSKLDSRHSYLRDYLERLESVVKRPAVYKGVFDRLLDEKLSKEKLLKDVDKSEEN